MMLSDDRRRRWTIAAAELILLTVYSILLLGLFWYADGKVFRSITYLLVGAMVFREGWSRVRHLKRQKDGVE